MKQTRREHLAQLAGGAGLVLLGPASCRWTPRGVMGTRGREAREIKDPAGRTIVQVTDNRFESKHSYYDVNPWSPDGDLILFSSADPDLLTEAWGDNKASRAGKVCVMDARNLEISTVAEGGFYGTHTGTFAMWHPLRRKVYYRVTPEIIGWVDLETGKRATMKGVLRQLSPDGKTFVSQLNWSDRPGDPGAVGFYTMNEDGSDTRMIVPIAKIYDAAPNRNEFRIEQMTVGNPKWTPDGKNLLLTMWVHEVQGVRRSLYVADRDGSNLRWLTHFGHHHSWTPDGKCVLFNDWKDPSPDGTKLGMRLHLVDFDGGNRRIVLDEPLGSHPIMDPSGNRIVDSDGIGIFVVYVKEKRVKRVATYRKKFDQSHAGTQPHPVWSRDGKHILYNSAETGHSELYLINT